MFNCPNCGTVSTFSAQDMGSHRCPMCGYDFGCMMNQGVPPKRQSKFGWWFLFILLELSSFSVALLFCWVFSKALDTDVFVREKYLIFVVWFFVTYKIYQKLRYKLF